MLSLSLFTLHLSLFFSASLREIFLIFIISFPIPIQSGHNSSFIIHHSSFIIHHSSFIIHNSYLFILCSALPLIIPCFSQLTAAQDTYHRICVGYPVPYHTGHSAALHHLLTVQKFSSLPSPHS